MRNAVEGCPSWSHRQIPVADPYESVLLGDALIMQISFLDFAVVASIAITYLAKFMDIYALRWPSVVGMAFPSIS